MLLPAIAALWQQKEHLGEALRSPLVSPDLLAGTGHSCLEQAPR